MTTITLKVSGAKAMASVNGVLTSGMVGVPVTIEYDDIWNGLTKNLVCRCGQWGPDRGETRTVLGVEETAEVAHEVMQADRNLYLGVEGYSADGTLVIPTTWADCGRIRHGAAVEADPSADPKLAVWAQLQTRITQIENDLTVPRGGLSQKLRLAIYNLLMDAVYQSAGHEADKTALEELLTGGAETPDVPDMPDNPDNPGDPEITYYYSVDKRLTNVSISNGAATVLAGSAYWARLIPDEGYKIEQVSVSMGGTEVPVTDGVIDIASVMGNIVIVATAVAESVGGHEWESGVAYDLTDKVTEGIELVTGSGRENAKDTYVTTDYLNCFDADAIYHSAALARLFFYDVNKNYISDAYKNAKPSVKAVPDNAVYVRLTCLKTYWTAVTKIVPIAKSAETYTPGTQNVAWETGRLDANTGAEITASGSRSDFICINGAKCLRIPNTLSIAVVCLYDVNKTFICGLTSVIEPVDIPTEWAGFSYIRIFVGTSLDVILDDSTIYTVTRTLTQVSYANAANACSSEPYTNTLTAKTGYTLDGGTVTITMGGTDITETAYTAETGEVYIENVTGAIVIKATAVAVTE